MLRVHVDLMDKTCWQTASVCGRKPNGSCYSPHVLEDVGFWRISCKDHRHCRHSCIQQGTGLRARCRYTLAEVERLRSGWRSTSAPINASGSREGAWLQDQSRNNRAERPPGACNG